MLCKHIIKWLHFLYLYMTYRSVILVFLANTLSRGPLKSSCTRVPARLRLRLWEYNVILKLQLWVRINIVVLDMSHNVYMTINNIMKHPSVAVVARCTVRGNCEVFVRPDTTSGSDHRRPITRLCTVCIRAACATTCRCRGIQVGWPPVAVAGHTPPGMWSSTCHPARTRTSGVWYGRWAARQGIRIWLCLQYCQRSKHKASARKSEPLRSTAARGIITLLKSFISFIADCLRGTKIF